MAVLAFSNSVRNLVYVEIYSPNLKDRLMKLMGNILDRIQDTLAQASHLSNDARHPYVTLSYAQSIDGSIAARPGRPLALSGTESMVFTHRLRSLHDGILVGIGTILSDNPHLTVRHVRGTNPQPIIVDSRLRFPLDAHALHYNSRLPWIATAEETDFEKEEVLVRSGAKVLHVPLNSDSLVDLAALLGQLKEMGIRSLMVEGGAQIITNFLKHKLVDQLVLTMAPIYVGGLHAVWPLQLNLSNPTRLENIDWEMYGSDLVLRADFRP